MVNDLTISIFIHFSKATHHRKKTAASKAKARKEQVDASNIELESNQIDSSSSIQPATKSQSKNKSNHVE